MVRRLRADEAELWRRVVESVRPLDRASTPPAAAKGAPAVEVAPPRGPSVPKPPPAKRAPPRGPGTTLDASWDRRLGRGLVQPDVSLDLHGHNLATAYDLLDRRLEQAIAHEARLLLLITGKAPSADRSRGAIRAAVGDWLAASRHASAIAAVRNAHPRHGGAGALYIILRRRRQAPSV